MTPDTPATSDQGHLRIRVDADADLQKWARKFDTTPDQIKAAVKEVGDFADDVEMHLKGTRSTSNAEAEQRTEPGPGQPDPG